MSTIHDCLAPNRANPYLRKLAALLARDEARKRPPVTLPGQPTVPITRAELKPPTPRLHTGWGPQLDHCPRGEVHKMEAEPEDVHGPYRRGQLLYMNRRFIEQMERAFAHGTEKRESACASYKTRACGLTGRRE